ncbi:opine dehydrogenase [Myroides gitamensis]|uniref:2-dehydropantoate 2-reductase n=1 Tax=Myroides odoratus TaxID=256 RepID=A0A378RJ10_MYROD|nr:NAD/NADP octopine/nopaline dehydrogenase family protein [Myroides odoratus]MCS4238344.1 opine dehydrogenase [Myroides odoratus]MDH6600849.1 opine dehydrogenase [Myroides gitamensis]QQU05447.1 NAD/NADP octopine/nopaline dehydrogenase family protein [Myroides odoratus]STZ27033.1 Opine dehydrogenase [Myroides odoratus]
MKYTVIGTGNVGLIHGAYLHLLGHEVTFLKSSTINSDTFNVLCDKKEYSINDFHKYDHKIVIHNITTSFEAAIPGADVILVTTTTLQHEDIAKRIAPYVKDGQIICLMPSYASMAVFKRYIDKNIKYVEFETTVYNGRILSPSKVNVSFQNCRVAASFTNFTEEEKEQFKSAFFPIDLERKSSYDIALHNPNMIVHTIGVLLSASRIEYSQGEFWLYKEAFTPAIINVIKQFDVEKNKILKALKCPELSYFDAAKWRNEEDLNKDSLEVFRSFSEEASKGPNSLNHRYLKEDIPMGVVMMESLGKLLEIETPIATAIINLSGALLNIDFRANGNIIKTI